MNTEDDFACVYTRAKFCLLTSDLYSCKEQPENRETETPQIGVKVGSVLSVVNRFLVAKETISLVAACLPHLTKLVSISSKEQCAVASQEIKTQLGLKFIKYQLKQNKQTKVKTLYDKSLKSSDSMRVISWLHS